MKSAAACFPFFILLLLASCSDKQKAMDASAMRAKVDSLVALRLDEVNRKVMEDLDYRMTIEVRQKADSIVQARTTANQAPKD